MVAARCMQKMLLPRVANMEMHVHEHHTCTCTCVYMYMYMCVYPYTVSHFLKWKEKFPLSVESVTYSPGM